MENDENGGEGGAGDGEIPEIELIIRASTIDGRRKGACLFCQVPFLFPIRANSFRGEDFTARHTWSEDSNRNP